MVFVVLSVVGAPGIHIAKKRTVAVAQEDHKEQHVKSRSRDRYVYGT